MIHFTRWFARTLLHVVIYLCVLSMPVQLYSQQKQIKGTVRALDTKEPVAGASILLVGSAKGTSTRDDGTFVISAQVGDKLLITAVGYLRTEVAVKNQTEIDIDLPVDGKVMETVVVTTALGIKREQKALGYSVTSVAGETITNAPANNWTNALSGRVAGVNLLKSGGGPAGSINIVLRGENSLTGSSNALIVVDGAIISGSSGKITGTGSSSYLQGESPVDFGSSLSDLNPDDIESVTVLKGPGAAALYGARGANGAIIITTKNKKNANRKATANFSSNLMLESINHWPDYQYLYGQGTALQHTWYSYLDTEDGPSTRSTSSAWGPLFNGQQYFQYDPVTRAKSNNRLPWIAYPDNRKDFFQQGSTLTNTVAVEAGDKNNNIRLSYTNLNNKWIIPNTGYARNTISLSANKKVTKKLQLTTKINFTNKFSNNLPSTGYNNQSIMYFIRGMTPNISLDWFKEYWVPGRENIEQTRPFSSLLDNPYLIANEMLNGSNRNGWVGNVSASYTFTKRLSLMVRGALDASKEDRAQQRSFGTNKFAEGMYRSQNIKSREQNIDFLFRYSQNMGKNIKSNYSFGGSRLYNKYDRLDSRADQLAKPGIYTLENAKNFVLIRPYHSEYRVNSMYGMAQFTWKDFVYLDITARQDWTSVLATPTSAANTGFFYPSINLSTVISDKIDLGKTISFLKLRTSYSSVGSGGDRPYLTSYIYDSTLFTGGLSNPSAIANPDLRPLRTNSMEVGMDMRFFKNRYGIDIALYRNNTKDQIFIVPIDRASGFNGFVGNAGLVRNKGIEVQADAQIIKKKKGLNWKLYGTFSTNDNKVVSLTEGIDVHVMSTGPANRGSIEARPGGSMGDLYGIGYERSPDGKIVYNEQGLPIRTTTIKYLGNVNADWKAGIGSECKIGNLRFNFLFDGQKGGIAYSLTHAVLAEEGKLMKTVPGRYNGIIGDGVMLDAATQKYIPNTTLVTNIQSYYDAHFNRDNVEANTFSTDFIKLREARIDYTLPTSVMRKVSMSRATIGVYGRDLFVFSNWPSFDPEFGTLNDGEINAGFEIGQFPSTRSYGVSLSLTF